MYRGSCGTVNAGMAAAPVQGTPPVLSLRNGCRCASDHDVTVEELLLSQAYTVRFSSDFEPNSDSCDSFFESGRISALSCVVCRAVFVQCTGGNEKR